MPLSSGRIREKGELRSFPALYPLQLEIGRPLHAMPVDIGDFEAADLAWPGMPRRRGFSFEPRGLRPLGASGGLGLREGHGNKGLPDWIDAET